MYYVRQVVFQDEIRHAGAQNGGQRQNHKYVGRVSTGKGWRYFYNTAEMQAYGKAAKNGVKSATQTVKAQAGKAKKALSNIINNVANSKQAKSVKRKVRQAGQNAEHWVKEKTGYYKSDKYQKEQAAHQAKMNAKKTAYAKAEMEKIKRQADIERGKKSMEAKKAYDKQIVEEGNKMRIRNESNKMKKNLSDAYSPNGNVRNVKDEAKIKDRQTAKAFKDQMAKDQKDLQTKKVTNVADQKKIQATKERNEYEKFVREQNKKGKQYEDYLQNQEFKERQKQANDAAMEKKKNENKFKYEVQKDMKEQEKRNNYIKDERVRQEQEAGVYDKKQEIAAKKNAQNHYDNVKNTVTNFFNNLNHPSSGTGMSRKTGSAPSTMTPSQKKARLKQLKKKYLGN